MPHDAHSAVHGSSGGSAPVLRAGPTRVTHGASGGNLVQPTPFPPTPPRSKTESMRRCGPPLALVLAVVLTALVAVAAANKVKRAYLYYPFYGVDKLPPGSEDSAQESAGPPSGVLPFPPQATLPTPASPFALIHLPKCAGSSMRFMLHKIMTRAGVDQRDMCIVSRGTLGYNQFRVDTCDPYGAAAAAVAGVSTPSPPPGDSAPLLPSSPLALVAGHFRCVCACGAGAGRLGGGEYGHRARCVQGVGYM
jgi:hypothetical protein